MKIECPQCQEDIITPDVVCKFKSKYDTDTSIWIQSCSVVCPYCNYKIRWETKVETLLWWKVEGEN